MEKQLALFQVEENDDPTIWLWLPEQNREKIESIFTRILIKHLSSSLEEVEEHEN